MTSAATPPGMPDTTDIDVTAIIVNYNTSGPA